jgi:recombinase
MLATSAFIANLLESGDEVTPADVPEANRYVSHIMAAAAEQEGPTIYERTSAALVASNLAGTVRSALLSSVRLQGRVLGWAPAHAQNVLPVVEQIWAGGASLRQIAAELNTRGIKTARGEKWYAITVRNILRINNCAHVRATQKLT